MVLDSYFDERHDPRPTSITDEAARDVTAAVQAHINREFAPAEVMSPDDETREAIIERIHHWTQKELRARGLGGAGRHLEAAMADRIRHQMLGLGFLEPFLARDDISELSLNPDGSFWTMRRGATTWIRAEDVDDDFVLPSPTGVRIVIDKLLGAVNRRISEAEPIVSAKIPRSRTLPAGARVNVVAPPIANGDYPALNVRLYEPEPVPPEKLLAWRELSEPMMAFLRQAVADQLRIMVAGGTATGKTTLLSCLVGLIPHDQRIVLVEDPAEIFVEHPQALSLEARPPTVEGQYGVSVGDLVTTAMRMSPRWLVVGEVRQGDAGVWLMRAQMSDHPGMSSIHAADPKVAVETLCLLAQIDHRPPVPYRATKTLVARSIDLFVQIGVDHFGVRRVTRIGQVEPRLKHGEVFIKDLFLYRPEQSTKEKPVWEQVGRRTRSRTVV